VKPLSLKGHLYARLYLALRGPAKALLKNMPQPMRRLLSKTVV